MNISNIVLLILVIVLLFVIYNKKSKENFTDEFEILAENDQRYKADVYNIERWYKINKESWLYTQDVSESQDLGYSWKFKNNSKIEFNPTSSFKNNYTVSFLVNFSNLGNNQAIFYGEESNVKYMELVLENEKNLILKFKNNRQEESLTLTHDFVLSDFYHVAIIYKRMFTDL